MKTAKYIIMAATTCIVTGCAITGRINRQQTNARITHTDLAANDTEIVEFRQSERGKGHIEYHKADGTTQMLPPSAIGGDGAFLAPMIAPQEVATNFRATPERRGAINVDFVIMIPEQLMGNCRGVSIKPVLHQGVESIPLEEISIRGGLFSKVQKRNVWQYDRYNETRERSEIDKQWAYERFVYYPYPENTRLDTMIMQRGTISYFYRQQAEVNNGVNKMYLTFRGKVKALDHSDYDFPLSDTLTYNISSMLDFADTTTRYITKVIEKYVTVNDRNYLHFVVGKADINDTLRDNRDQLARMESLMDEIINQREFHVDNITLTAMASPDGSVRLNETMSRARAHSLRNYLVKKFPGKRLNDLITVKWIGEDWDEFERILAEGTPMTNHNAIYDKAKNRADQDLDALDNGLRRDYPDDYKYLLDEIYPKLRAVDFRYDLRRVGMVQETVHTFVPDTLYARGVALMTNREYGKALEILQGFADRNTAICLLSLGMDEAAYSVLNALPESAINKYLTAIACARLNRKGEALKHYERACELHSSMEYRGKYDPEIANLIQ